jgi:hypothetical protein
MLCSACLPQLPVVVADTIWFDRWLETMTGRNCTYINSCDVFAVFTPLLLASAAAKGY